MDLPVRSTWIAGMSPHALPATVPVTATRADHTGQRYMEAAMLPLSISRTSEASVKCIRR